MNTTRMLVAGVCLLATIGQAAALERRGTSSLQWPDGKGPVHDFRTGYDPATGAVTRAGTVKLADGRTVTYEAHGKCEPGFRACTWTGTGTGPFGGKWTVAGSFARDADGTNRLEQTLVAPTGQRIVMRHTSSGDQFPLDLR